MREGFINIAAFFVIVSFVLWLVIGSIWAFCGWLIPPEVWPLLRIAVYTTALAAGILTVVDISDRVIKWKERKEDA